MKERIIKSHLTKVFNSFVESIECEETAKAVKLGTIITGGAIASLLLKERPNDYDMYFKDKETCLKVANYYVDKFNKNKPNKFKNDPSRTYEAKVREVDYDGEVRVEVFIKSAGIVSEDGTDDYEYFESQPDESITEAFVDSVMPSSGTDAGEKYRPVFMSTNAITLSHDIQLILRFYGEPQEIHENYDFVHCTSYWTSWDRKLECPKEALSALLSKELIYVGSRYPIASLIRIRKFLKRDFNITAGQILKICMTLQDFDLTDPAVLKDQLTGVDVAYFNEILAKLKEKDADKIDTAYLMQIIDRMF